MNEDCEASTPYRKGKRAMPLATSFAGIAVASEQILTQLYFQFANVKKRSHYGFGYLILIGKYNSFMH